MPKIVFYQLATGRDQKTLFVLVLVCNGNVSIVERGMEEEVGDERKFIAFAGVKKKQSKKASK